MLKSLKIAAVATLIALTGTVANATEEAGHHEMSATKFFSSFMDTSTWDDGSKHLKHGQIVKFNPLNVADWAQVVDPKQHVKFHMSVTNPEHFAQYMNPQFFMQMMNPETYANLFNQAAIINVAAVVTDPKTSEYWTQPGAYMHAMSPEGYMQLANPVSYMKLATTVMTTMADPKAWGDESPFSPFTWLKTMSESVAPKTDSATE